MTVKRGTVESLIMFVLSPFLSIPFILYGIKNRSRIADILMIIILSLISYLYIPFYSNDKVRFIERYEQFHGMSFSQYLDYLVITMRPDFIYETLIYLFSIFNIKIDFLFFIITFLTLFQLLRLTRSINIGTDGIFFFFFFFFSLSFLNIFSGVRFFFGFSLLISAVYYLIVKERWLIFLLFLLLSFLTHFSMLIFFIPILMLKYAKKWNFKLLFFCSLIFLFFPKTILTGLFEQLSLIDAYTNKIDVYVLNDKESETGSMSTIISFYGKIIWYYFAIIYLLFIKETKKNIWLNLFLISATFVNITYSIPIVFQRYTFVLKYLFLLYIISSILTERRKIIKYMFFFLFILGSLIEINQMRYNLEVSLFRTENISLYGILKSEITEQDIIKN